MSQAAGRPPVLSAEDVALIVTKHFHFSVVHSFKPLPSYCDRNYYFRGQNETGEAQQFILKVASPLSTSHEVIEGILRLMKHLNSRSMLVPCPISSLTDGEVLQLSRVQLRREDNEEMNTLECQLSSAELKKDGGNQDTMKYPVYVLSFIPGQMFDHVDKNFLTPALLYEVGELLGKIDKELMDNFPSQTFVSEVSQDWNLIHFPKLKSYLEHIEGPFNKRNAEKVIRDFEEHVSPVIPSLRTAIIHGDLNGLNIVLKDMLPTDEGCHVAGFIDFNDSVKTCLIFELGVSLAHIMSENLHPVTCSSVVEFVGPMIRAYNSVLPLSAEELDCLYHVVLARCCQVTINSVLCFAAEPWNVYLIDRNKTLWRFVDYMLSVPKSEVDRIWSKYISRRMGSHY